MFKWLKNFFDTNICEHEFETVDTLIATNYVFCKSRGEVTAGWAGECVKCGKVKFEFDYAVGKVMRNNFKARVYKMLRNRNIPALQNLFDFEKSPAFKKQQKAVNNFINKLGKNYE